jgi:hypothetical protein
VLFTVNEVSRASSDESESRRKGPSVGVRVAVSGGAGALRAFVVAIVGPWWLILLFGWDIAALVSERRGAPWLIVVCGGDSHRLVLA